MATTALKDDKDQWSSKVYNTNAHFVYSTAFTSAIVNLLAPKPGERILDVGCGSGELTLELVPAVGPQGFIHGTDSSSDLLKKANELKKEQGATNIQFDKLDGHDTDSLPEGSYDAVFSNAALHWMKADPPKVVAGAYKVLKKGGRFVAEFGGHLNMVAVRSALHQVMKEKGHDSIPLDPWYFPTAEDYSKVLKAAGFRVESAELVPRITPLPTGLRGWLETFAFTFLEPLESQAEKDAVIDEVCNRLAFDLETKEQGWRVMYVRLRIVAYKD
ncbi:cyclopropane-fatty-acyl-phospholipid synthase [Meredithblackwellia eburnea MCA 4105]